MVLLFIVLLCDRKRAEKKRGNYFPRFLESHNIRIMKLVPKYIVNAIANSFHDSIRAENIIVANAMVQIAHNK